MKIVHITHLYHPSEGGVQFLFKKLSERLVRDYGDEVTVITTNSYYGPERSIFKEVTPTSEVINGVKVIRFPYRRWHIPVFRFIFKVLAKLSLPKPDWMALQAYGPVSKSMRKYLMEVDADVVCGAPSNYYYMMLPKWRKVNFFYYGSTHFEKNERKFPFMPTEINAIRSSTMYLANTEYEKHRMENMGMPAKKIAVIGTGVDIEDFIVEQSQLTAYRSALNIPADAIVIGYAGRIEKTKNVFKLLLAFEKLAAQHTNIHLLIAGSGSDYVDHLQQYVQSWPTAIAQRVHWKISFSSEEKPFIFNTLDVLVLPSINESFGIVFLEAWSCKKPVIGAGIGAVKNVINDEVDGLLIDTDDEQSLQTQLARLIADGCMRKRLGEAGYNKVKESFTWEIITAKLRKLYEESLLDTRQ